jgi:hypothetical protein
LLVKRKRSRAPSLRYGPCGCAQQAAVRFTPALIERPRLFAASTTKE